MTKSSGGYDQEWSTIFFAAAQRGQNRTQPRSSPLWHTRDSSDLLQFSSLAAKELVSQLGTEATEGAISVEGLAAVMGFSVKVTDQHTDGHLPNPDGGLILVKRRATTARTRFTIAHELAHAWLARLDPIHPMVQDLAPSAVESLCDLIAGQVLLPDALVKNLPKLPDYAHLAALADTAKVSLPVVMIRANQTGKWRALLITWDATSDGWRPISTYGGPWDARNWRMEAGEFARPEGRAWRNVMVDQEGRSVRTQMQLGVWARSRIRTLVHSVESRSEGRR